MINSDMHMCQGLNLDSPSFEVKIVRENGAWLLKHESYSVMQDVWAGEAEGVGETMSSFALRIGYCPFCGIFLAQ